MEDSAPATEYSQLWRISFQSIKANLQLKKWFAFDLDDTLHDFRAASSAAVGVVLARINADYGSDVNVMREAYNVILKDKTSSAFTDGRTSSAYRKERFEVLMERVGLVPNNDYLDTLAGQYQEALSHSLCLKPGVPDLLDILKRLGKKVIIVTEGPEDAQIWTVQQLGIDDKVDFIATTSRFGVSKVDGLLQKVMTALDIPAHDLVYCGDNWTRDIEPAIQANVFAIHYAKNENVSLDQIPIRINTHYKTYDMLTDILASPSDKVWQDMVSSADRSMTTKNPTKEKK